MNRDQMIAWLTLEGWNPTTDGDMVHKGDAKYANTFGVHQFTTRVGAYTLGECDMEWGQWVEEFPRRLEIIYEVISSQVP